MKAVWAGVMAAGAVLLLAACAPAATPGNVSSGPDQEWPDDVVVTPYASPTWWRELPPEEPLPSDAILRDYTSRGYIWVKGQFIKLPEGVRISQVAPMRGGAVCREWRYCPQEIWTLYKEDGSFRFSPTDGVVIGDFTDPNEPTAFAFLTPYVIPAGSLLDDWPAAWRSYKGSPPPPPLTGRPTVVFTPDPRTTFNEADVREMTINGSRVALPPGVVYLGATMNDCLPGIRCLPLTVALQKGNSYLVLNPATSEVDKLTLDPQDPAAFDFLKPFLPEPWGRATVRGAVLGIWPERVGTGTPP